MGILGDEGNERNAEAYKASRGDDSLHCEDGECVNFGELVDLQRDGDQLDRSVPCPQWLG